MGRIVQPESQTLQVEARYALEALRRATGACWTAVVQTDGQVTGVVEDLDLSPEHWIPLAAVAPYMLERLHNANRAYFWFVPEKRFPVHSKRALVIRTSDMRLLLAGWDELPMHPEILPAFLSATGEEINSSKP